MARWLRCFVVLAFAASGCSGSEVDAVVDAGQADQGSSDTLGAPDAEAGLDSGPDAGEPDTGPPDLGEPDAGNWPAELRADAQRLFNSAPSSIRGQNNWSGAHFNPVTSQLWLVRDTLEIRVYDYDDGFDVFRFNERFPPTGDFEGITQTDYNNAREVYVLAENQDELRRYDFAVSTTATPTWDLTSVVGGGGTLEGLVFVPDAILASAGFVDGSGALFPASRGGLGGLMLISHQFGGDIYALDLASDGTFTQVGRYRTPLSSTRGLELDRDTGLVYMVDGEQTARIRLSSTNGVFDVVDTWPEPGPDGAEGIALTPSSAVTQWMIITDDDNLEGTAAVLRYREFRP